MKTKRGFFDRLRSWFPEEPKLNKTIFDTSAKADDPQGQDSYKAKDRSNIWTWLYFLISLPLYLLIFSHYFSLINLAITIVVGVSVGGIVGFIPFYRELKVLDKQGNSNIKLSTTILSVFLIADMCIIVGAIIGQGGFPFNEFQLIIITSGAISAIIGMAVRSLLVAAWERKNKIKIMMRGFSIFSVPKSPHYAKV